MDIFDVLKTIAQVSVTLVGFAAIFRAFRKPSNDLPSYLRITVIIEVGLITTLACFTPLFFLNVPPLAGFAWSISSLLALIFYLRQTIMHTRLFIEYKSDARKALIIPLIYVWLVPLVLLVSASQLVSWDNGVLYLLAIMMMQAEICMVFYLQFRHENEKNS